MLAIEVEYLGRVTATRFNDRQAAEWPPHPARLYSALVAVYAAGPDDDPGAAARREAERSALEWLARARPPSLRASDASRRAVYTNFVPVNDTTVVRQKPIHNAISKVRALERDLSAAADDKARGKLVRKLETANRRLRDMARRQSTATDKGKEPSLEILPEHRKKQGRTFPSVTPDDPRVYWIWTQDAPPTVVAALDGLARRLVRLGHSSTLVRARCVGELPDGVEPNWFPDPDGEHFLRLPLRDQLSRLEDLYLQHQGVEPRVLPFRWETYRQEVPAPVERVQVHAHRVFDREEWIVLQRGDGPDRGGDVARHLPMTRVADLSRRVRDALFSHADGAGITLPESVTGHRADGSRSDQPHMAVLPLPYVASPYADGNIRGVALVLPRQAAAGDRRLLLKTLGSWERAARSDGRLAALNEDLEIPTLPIYMGRAGVFHLSRLVDRSNMRTLQVDRWTRPARRWRSVTPVALDRNPGHLGSANPAKARRAAAEAEAIIRKACARLGLPEPEEIAVSFAPTVVASPHASAFPPYPAVQRPDKPRRVLIHVALRFGLPVEGPVLLGAGRYYGLGLFLPVSDRAWPGGEGASRGSGTLPTRGSASHSAGDAHDS